MSTPKQEGDWGLFACIWLFVAFGLIFHAGYMIGDLRRRVAALESTRALPTRALPSTERTQSASTQNPQ